MEGMKKETKQDLKVTYGFKGTELDQTCRGVKYKLNEWVKYGGEPIICQQGLHICGMPLECLAYYRPSSSLYFKAEAAGKTDRDRSSHSTKIAATRVRVTEKLSVEGLYKAARDYCEQHKIGSRSTGYVNDDYTSLNVVDEQCSAASCSGIAIAMSAYSMALSSSIAITGAAYSIAALKTPIVGPHSYGAAFAYGRYSLVELQSGHNVGIGMGVDSKVVAKKGNNILVATHPVEVYSTANNVIVIWDLNRNDGKLRVGPGSIVVFKDSDRGGWCVVTVDKKLAARIKYQRDLYKLYTEQAFYTAEAKNWAYAMPGLIGALKEIIALDGAQIKDKDKKMVRIAKKAVKICNDYLSEIHNKEQGDNNEN